MELPDDYAARDWDVRTKTWIPLRREFADETRHAFETKAEEWSPFWPQAYRWAVLFDRFVISGAPALSAELRQLEKSLKRLVEEHQANTPSTDLSAEQAEGDRHLAEVLSIL